MSDPNRTRTTGLSNLPGFYTKVRLFNTLVPDEGWGEWGYLESEAPMFHQTIGRASVFSDQVGIHGPNAAGYYTMARPAAHYTMEYSSLNPVTGNFEFGPYLGQFIIDPMGSGIMGDGSFASQTGYVCPPPPQSVVSPFAAKCRVEMCSQFPPEIDMASFLAELKDIPGIITNLVQILDFLQLTGYGGKRRPTVRDAASIHAGYNFGTSPIIGDFTAIASILKNVKNRLEWLRRNRNKWVRIGCSSSYSDDTEVGLGGFGFAGWSPGMGLARVGIRGELRCTARVKQNFPWLDTWEGWVRGVIGGAGFNRPLTSVWELTPFSWLVDYFIPVGEYLSMVSFEDITDWTVRDPSWSVKTYYDFRLPVGFTPEFEFIGFGSCGSFTVKRYYRSVGLPPWELYLKNPTAKQWSLLAAVAILEE